MVTANAARNIVGVIGNIISLGLFLSPVPTFVKIWKKKAVEEFSPVPYLATLLNCMMWVFYGIPVVHPNSLLVVTINGTGLVLEGIYLSIFFFYALSQGRLRVLKILAVELVFMAAVVIGVVTGAHTHEKRTLIVGILCVIFGVCMYAAPLVVMKRVITTRSVKYMPFFLSLTGFLNGVCWALYALIKFDIFILIPNGLGALLGLAQIVLYACYCRKTPREEEELPKSDVQMSTAYSASAVAPGSDANISSISVR